MAWSILLLKVRNDGSLESISSTLSIPILSKGIKGMYFPSLHGLLRFQANLSLDFQFL